MKVTIMLADAVQAVNGKLYILGGGWSIIDTQPTPSAIAVKIEVPWNETNRKHSVKIELLDSDYRPVLVPSQHGETPLIIGAEFEVGRPAGLIQGSHIDVPLAFNIAPIPLEPGKRYVWKLTIDGNEKEEWETAFSTRHSVQRPPA